MIYSRFGSVVTLLRPATEQDIRSLDNREPDDHDRERIRLGMFAVGTMELEDKTQSDERVLELGYLNADGASQEIDEAAKAVGLAR